MEYIGPWERTHVVGTRVFRGSGSISELSHEEQLQQAADPSTPQELLLELFGQEREAYPQEKERACVPPHKVLRSSLAYQGWLRGLELITTLLANSAFPVEALSPSLYLYYEPWLSQNMQYQLLQMCDPQSARPQPVNALQRRDILEALVYACGGVFACALCVGKRSLITPFLRGLSAE